MIKSLSDLDPNGSYTYADYLTWWFDERVELIKGKLFKMSPAPNTRHQKIAKEIVFLLETHIRKSRCGCELFFAPFDVRLPRKNKRSDEEIITVVQPDICVICDSSKLDGKGCLGAPELVIEILSPGNSNREMKAKFNIYQETGVLEYWVIDSERKQIIVNILNDAGAFVPHKPYTSGTTIHSTTLPGLSVVLDELFSNIH